MLTDQYLNINIFVQETEEASMYETEPMIEFIFVHSMTLNISSRYVNRYVNIKI